jgi:uncharacterized protein YjbI with pentapeptide repeats
MANEEQLSILKQGVKIWNEWINNSGVAIDLSNDDLRHINLANAYLGGANPTGANLSYSDLHRANLWDANLLGAKLIGTKLSGAEPSDNGKLVFVSYWDSGFIALDLKNPAQPVFKGRTDYPAHADGDAHSASYDDVRKLLFSADEDSCKTGQGIEKGLGYLLVWDDSNLAGRRR